MNYNGRISFPDYNSIGSFCNFSEHGFNNIAFDFFSPYYQFFMHFICSCYASSQVFVFGLLEFYITYVEYCIMLDYWPLVRMFQ